MCRTLNSRGHTQGCFPASPCSKHVFVPSAFAGGKQVGQAGLKEGPADESSCPNACVSAWLFPCPTNLAEGHYEGLLRTQRTLTLLASSGTTAKPALPSGFAFWDRQATTGLCGCDPPSPPRILVQQDSAAVPFRLQANLPAERQSKNVKGVLASSGGCLRFFLTN